MYLAPACFVWLMAGVAVVEWPAMRDNDALQLILNKPLWYFAAAAMGFCVNLLAYMVIQTASSLTLKVPLSTLHLLDICSKIGASKQQPLCFGVAYMYVQSQMHLLSCHMYYCGLSLSSQQWDPL